MGHTAVLKPAVEAAGIELDCLLNGALSTPIYQFRIYYLLSCTLWEPEPLLCFFGRTNLREKEAVTY